MQRSKGPSQLHSITLAALAALMAAGTLLAPGAALAAPAGAPPVPKAPAGEITDTTPTFQWTKVAGATAYQLDVWQGGSIYVVGVSSSACTATLCSKTPATVLAFATHLFRVRAKVSGVWGPWSVFRAFKIVSSGFNSQFSSTTDGWLSVHGSWFLGATTIYSEGSSSQVNSLYYPAVFSTFTYEARLRRSGCPACGLANGLYFRGSPFSLSIFFHWNNGFWFSYTNEGTFAIAWFEDGGFVSPTGGWVPHSAIVPNGYNLLKVTANGSYMQFFINGVLIADGYFDAFSSGHVGVNFFNDAGRLDVDYANLSTSAPAGPTAASQADGVLHLDDSMAVPFDPTGSP